MPKVNIRHFAIEKFFARSGKKFYCIFNTESLADTTKFLFYCIFNTGGLVLADTTKVPPHEPPLCIYVVHVQYPARSHNQIAVAGVMFC